MTAPQSDPDLTAVRVKSSATTRKTSVKPTIGTPDHLLNSDTVVAVNPFASPVVKESISFDKALCEFLKLHFHVHEAKAREWMHAAHTEVQTDSEALRFSKVVHQAENAHWNQLGQFRGHFAVWHADPLYMRAYEAWPDLTMHERYSRLKMALGPVSTPFNFVGTLDEAVAALEKFILTGEIPKPAPPSPALVAACKNDEISRRSAALEKAFEKPAVVHGPVKVAAQKIAEPGENVVKLTEDDDDDLDDWFPRDEPKVEKPADEKPEHWSQTARFNKALTAIQNKNEASRILKSSVFRDFAHNECEVISFKDLPNTPDAEKHSLETIEQSADLKYGPKKDKPMPEKTMENAAPATAAPAKPNDAPAGKAEPQTYPNYPESPVVVYPMANGSTIYKGIKFSVTLRLGGTISMAVELMEKFHKAHAEKVFEIDHSCLINTGPMQNAATGGSVAPSLPTLPMAGQPATLPVPAAPDGAKPDNKGRQPGQSGMDAIAYVERNVNNNKETIALWTASGKYPEHTLRRDNDKALVTSIGINVPALVAGTKYPVQWQATWIVTANMNDKGTYFRDVTAIRNLAAVPA